MHSSRVVVQMTGLEASTNKLVSETKTGQICFRLVDCTNRLADELGMSGSADWVFQTAEEGVV